MDNEKLQILRDWSAKKMNGELHGSYWYFLLRPFDSFHKIIPVDAWRPDDMDSPGWQISYFIKKMEESGWRLSVDNLTTPGKYDVEFIHKNYNPDDDYPEGVVSARGDNLFLAILIAANRTDHPDKIWEKRIK